MTDDKNINEQELIAKIESQGFDKEALSQLNQDQLMALFVEQLIADKGLNGNDRLRAELTEKINLAINRAVVANLTDEDVDRINNENLSDEEIANLIEESDIDVDRITEMAMTNFREKYLSEGEEA